MPPEGIEPSTPPLPRVCSTPELRRQGRPQDRPAPAREASAGADPHRSWYSPGPGTDWWRFDGMARDHQDAGGKPSLSKRGRATTAAESAGSRVGRLDRVLDLDLPPLDDPGRSRLRRPPWAGPAPRRRRCNPLICMGYVWRRWCRRKESNLRPHPYQGCALRFRACPTGSRDFLNI